LVAPLAVAFAGIVYQQMAFKHFIRIAGVSYGLFKMPNGRRYELLTSRSAKD
jgi:hypothetical protein